MNTIQKDLLIKIKQFYKGTLPRLEGDNCIAIGKAKIYFTPAKDNRVKLFTEDAISTKFFKPWVEQYAKAIRR